MNVDWISVLPGPVRSALYFALQRLIGSRVRAAWLDLRAWSLLAPQELERAIDRRLGETLTRAGTSSEYYRDLKLTRQSGESAGDFLARHPVLTREVLRDNFARLVTDRQRGAITGPESHAGRGYDWLVVKTGGTTGVPTSVIHDAWFRDYGRATRLFTQALCGFPLGVRYFRLWGSEQDLLQSAERFDRQLLRNLHGEIPLNAFRAKEAELRHHLETMHRHPRVRHLMAYVDAAASLAEFIEEHQLPPPRFNTIMACAGTVTPEWRALLERVYHAEVFDKYGSRECAEIASECCAHEGLHVISPNVFVEIVDDDGQPCAPGQPGHVLVTLLNNHTFPMIRYAIGDLAVWEEGVIPCTCGLSFPRLRSIQGRADDMLTTESNTLLSSVFVRHFVGVSLNRQLILEWQLEQCAALDFVFRYVAKNQQGLPENLAALESALKTALGRSSIVHFEAVAEIPPSPTGKVRWIINRTRRRENQRLTG